MDIRFIVLFFCVAFGFGSAFALNSTAVAVLPPLWVAAGRAIVACLALGLVVLARRIRVSRDLESLRVYVLTAVFTSILPYTLLAWGQQHVPSSLAGIVFSGSPLLVIVLGTFLFGLPSPKARIWAGALIGLAGVAIALPIVTVSDTDQTIASFAVLGAAISYAFGSLTIQRQSAIDLLGLTFAQMSLAAVCLLVLALAVHGGPPRGAVGEIGPVIGLLGLTGTAIPIAALFALIRHRGATAAATTTFFIPFVAVGIGVLLLGESPTGRMAAGFALAIAGSYFTLARSAEGNRARPLDSRGLNPGLSNGRVDPGPGRITIDGPTGNLPKNYAVRLLGRSRLVAATPSGRKRGLWPNCDSRAILLGQRCKSVNWC